MPIDDPARNRIRVQGPGLLPRREFLWNLGGGLAACDGAPLGTERPAGRLGVVKRPVADLNGGCTTGPKPSGSFNCYERRRQPMRPVRLQAGADQAHGQKFDPGMRVEAATSAPGNLMKSPFEWKQHGSPGGGSAASFAHRRLRG